MGMAAAMAVVGCVCLWAPSRSFAGRCRKGGHSGLARSHRVVALSSAVAPVRGVIAVAQAASGSRFAAALGFVVGAWWAVASGLVPRLQLLSASVAPDEPVGERWVVGFQLILGWAFVQVAWTGLVVVH